MDEVIKAATGAAEASCKMLIERLCDADLAHEGRDSNLELREFYTVDKAERFFKRYGGRL